MAKQYPYFLWFPKDAESDEKYSMMTDAEVGFFHRCLNKSWVNEGLPKDPEARARLLKKKREIADKRWTVVGECFVESDMFDGRLVNPRQEIQRERAMTKSRKARESAEYRYKKNIPPKPNQEVLPSLFPPLPKKQQHQEVKTTDSQLQEVADAFDRHLKHSNREPKDLIIQQVLSMNGKFDWTKFRENHQPFCDHWANHGWSYCPISFLGWINAGMPPPPPKSKTAREVRDEERMKALLED